MRYKLSKLTFFYLCILFFVVIAVKYNIYGQERKVVFNKLNTDNGLSTNMVSDIVIDTLGFVWIATINGIDRFDGCSVKHYVHDPKDSTSISSKNIRSMCIDKAGRIWIGGDQGLSQYDPVNDCFINYVYVRGNKLIESSQVWGILPDNQNKLWIEQPYKETLSLFDPITEQVVYKIGPHKDSPVNLHASNIIFYTIDNNNRLWLIVDRESVCVSYDTDSIFIRHRLKGNYRAGLNVPPSPEFVFNDSKGNIYLSNNGFYKLHESIDDKSWLEYINLFEKQYPKDHMDFALSAIEEDNQGNFWISSSRHGLIVYNPKTGKIIEHLNKSNALPGNVVDKVEYDGSQNMWAFSEDKYVIRVDINTRDVIVHQHNETDFSSLSPFKSYIEFEQIQKAKDGVIFFSTVVSGLNYFNPDKNHFELFRHEKGNPNSLTSNNVWAIYEDHQGRVWIGTDGLDVYQPETGEYLHFSEYTNPNLQFLSKPVSAICEISTGNFLVAASGRVIWYKFEDSTLGYVRDFKPGDSRTNSLADWGTFSIIVDHRNEIWIGTSGGLNRYFLPDPENPEGKFINYNYETGNPNSLSNDYVWYIHEDSKDRIWICTVEGLCRINKKRNLITRINPVVDGRNIYKINPRCIEEFPYGVYWIATDGQGLFRYDEDTGQFIHYSTHNGLPADNLYSVFHDKEKNLWLSSLKGIIRFEPEKGQTELFTKNDGLQDNEFVAGAFHRGQQSGKLYMGGNKGLNAFDPSQISPSDFKPDIVFTDFYVNNSPVKIGQIINKHIILPEALNFLDQITLPHQELNFSLEFAALHYSSPGKIQYRYMLEGFEDEWIQINAHSNQVNYTNLDPGSYRFRVFSTNCDGIWQDNERSVEIIILPPWYGTWWAYSIYVVSLLLILFWTRKIILLKLHYNKQIELDQLKTRFFMNISHEFRTPLTLILGPLEKLIKHNSGKPGLKQLILIQRNSNRLLQLVNQLLDLRKLETQTMHLNLVKGDILAFIKQIFESFQYLAEKHEITYEFQYFNNISFQGLRNLAEKPLKTRRIKDNIIIDDKQKPTTRRSPENTEIQSITQNCFFDPDKLEKILCNLISNAFKYTPDGGSISVNVETKQIARQLWIITGIQDTGTGISRENLPQIFDRFFHVKAKTNPIQSGSGIGLSLTKELVEHHGGKISVESKEGFGSTFTFTIPLKESGGDGDIPVKIETKAGCQPSPPSATPENEYSGHYDIFKQVAKEHNKESSHSEDLPMLLIVDDNPDIRFYIRNDLEEDYTIIEAQDGKQGIEIAVAKIPDLIISDIMMPQMSGLEFCKKIKEDINTSHIPIIILTARSSEEHKIEGLETGSEDYISKPFSMEVLRLKINNILKSRQQLIAKYRHEAGLSAMELSNNHVDRDFLRKAEAIILQNISNPGIDVNFLSSNLGLSRMHLYRKIKGLSEQTPSEFIKTIRFKRAAKLLVQSGKNISEIAYEMGFSSPSNFSRSFSSHYNMSPSEYVAQNS